MNAIVVQRQLSPADVRCLRQLALEVRLLIDTACLQPARMRPFLRDALRHGALLYTLASDVLVDGEYSKLRALPNWARFELLASRGRRRCYRHRIAHVQEARRLLQRFEHEARKLEARLWDATD